MPAMAHIGVGLAAKKIEPTMNVGALVLASEAVEIVYMGLWALGIERPPTADDGGFSMYSHSVISGFVISFLVGLLTYMITKNKKKMWLMALVALSHTVMDVMASPMTAFYPTSLGKPVFWDNSFRIGLGLYRHPVIANILEYSITFIGIGIYIRTKLKLRNSKGIFNKVIKS